MIVTLTTDFGLDDYFVGAMKGALLSIAPKCKIVDICHNIPPQDIRKVFFVMREAFKYFPPKTLHVVVVDPSVGSTRHIIYAQSHGQQFLAPDNGVLSFLHPNTIEKLSIIDTSLFSLPKISNTFHGRDIFAPIAGQIVNKKEKLGRPMAVADMVRFKIPQATTCGNIIRGEIIYIDHFGNLVSNITPEILNIVHSSIEICGQTITNKVRHYSQVQNGQLLALFNSACLLEIAENQGNAAQRLNADIGTIVQCTAK